MKVFKFGGASVKSGDGVRNVASIIRHYPEDSIVVIISAMDKTTNALEELLQHFTDNDQVAMVECYQRIRNFHMSIIQEIFPDETAQVYNQTGQLFRSLQEYLAKGHKTDGHNSGYNFEYDQVVSYGELFSACILHNYLLNSGIASHLLDARKLIRTDSGFRNANVNWPLTGSNIREVINSLISEDYRNVFVTQGFIGGDDSGNTTTLGREGSDYTAAIIAHSLKTKEVTIWKDVPGVMNADPKWFENPEKLKLLSYREAIELAYYGASVIHPKTIKPLENENITLNVRSFLDPESEGTVIAHIPDLKIPCPVYILKKNQVLISISPRDYSFIVEQNLSQIFEILARHNIKVNVMQNSAISFTICVDADHVACKGVLDPLRETYSVLYNDNVELFTIRHYNSAAIRLITKGRKILMEQKTRSTVHLVLQ